MTNVSREGRIKLTLVDGEYLMCGACQEFIVGFVNSDHSVPEYAHAYIAKDGVETQDFLVVCSKCVGPEKKQK